MKKLLHFILFFLTTFSLYAQQGRGVRAVTENIVTKKGKTYALIIGISKYADVNMPQLQFADSDAIYFYRFLRSKSGGNADSINVRLLTNKNASSSDIWRELNWVMRRVDSSDRVYIYFSGHGDAGDNQEEVYFLTHETARVDDPGLYVPTSALPVMNLKTKIKTLVSKNVEVILITDACRTNELPGKNSGNEQIYRHVMDENIGAIQITSCKANQMAQESKKWGNGRGVFSYHLVNGLYGLADNSPEDGKVDLEELESYVKENVKKDTRSLSTGASLQVPVFTGRNTIISNVDLSEKHKIETGYNYNKSEIFIAVRKASFKTERSADSSAYDNLILSINEERLIAPENNNAVYWLDKLLPKMKDENSRADITDILVAALMKKGQQSINNYSSGLLDSITFNYQFFINNSLYFKNANKYVKNNPETYNLVNASRLFLEARALTASTKKEDWQKGLKLADSCLSLFQWAYTYHTKGLLFNSLEMYDSSLYFERKAIKIAPNWGLAYSNLGGALEELNQYDSAIYYYKTAIKLTPKDEIAYLSLGNTYHKLNQHDSAIQYYKSAIKLNPKNAATYYNLGTFYHHLNQFDSALYCYKMSLKLNPKNENLCNNLGTLYRSLNQNDSAVYFYKVALKYRPKYALANSNLASVFSDMSLFDSAIYYFQIAIKLNPKDEDTYLGLGNAYAYLKQNDSAKYYYKKLIEMNPKNDQPYYGLACIYSLSKEDKEALQYFDLSLKYGFTDFDHISVDTDLDNIRTTAEFKAILQKYFPEKFKK